jgi:hypothetical protein
MSAGRGAALQLADDGGALLRDFFCLLPGRGFDGFVGRWAARIVPILHAFLEESLACPYVGHS